MILADVTPPEIDYAGLSPIIALVGGICVVLLAAVFDQVKRFIPALTLLTLAVAGGLLIWQWGESKDLVSGVLQIDDFSIALGLAAVGAAMFTVFLSIREPATEHAGVGEYHVLLLGSVFGMTMLTQATSLLTLFIALEALSIPLYVLCATNLHRRDSLESGLKYLIIGSLGSATLLYGLAMIYGATGSTEFTGIAKEVTSQGLSSDPLLMLGIALVATGFAFKTSIAPFHQWTPDVYQGAPTPITAFMAVATKLAAFAVFVRFFLVALAPSAAEWDTALAALAAITIVVGNVGAIKQTSLKRMLGYSGVAQAGYILGGLVVATEVGVSALVFYLLAYTMMNLAGFAVIVARERETSHGDEIASVEDLGRSRPLMAAILTVSMLALAGLPGTTGFIGKLFLIEALIDGGYTWLAVMIVVGTMISAAYYMRVVAAVWVRPGADRTDPEALPAMAGGSPEADPIDPRAGTRLYLVIPALVVAAATVFFGIIPQPLVDVADHAAASLAQYLP